MMTRFVTPQSPCRILSIFPVVLLVLPLFVLTFAACDDDGELARCTISDECPDDQICVGGRCVDSQVQPCREPSDCPDGQTCVDNVCVDEAPGDMGDDVVDDPTTDPTADPQPEIVQDPVEEEIFEDAPVVASVDPEDGETGVAVDAPVAIEFDQPMAAVTFTPTNVRVEDWNGEAVSRRITYDAPTWTVALEAVDAAGNFDRASPYSVIVERNVRGDNELNLAERFESTFYTVTFEDLEPYAALAQAYAPVVYAEVRAPENAGDLTPRIDWFTALDFDGDRDLTNNLAHLKEANRDIPAVVYYNVLETQTHYLIQYVFYYPAAVDDPSDTMTDAVEHDFAYSLVVVEKIPSDPLGRFVMAEGLGDFQVWAFGLASYPLEPCGDEGERPCLTVDPQTEEVWVDFAASALEPPPGTDQPGRRYPAYIAQATHASCLAPDYVPESLRLNNRCGHNLGAGAPFWEDNADWSRILRVADDGSGDNWSGGPEDESNELTYELVPFLDLFWIQRSNPTIYDDARFFTPPAGSTIEDPLKVPSNLARAGEDFGNVSRRPPFQAEVDAGRACGGCSRIGLWFIDPAWELAGHVDFLPADAGNFSETYCFNPFAGIDIRGEEGCE